MAERISLAEFWFNTMEVLKMPMYIYAMVKELTCRIHLDQSRNNIGILISLIITTVLTPIALIFWLLCAIYRLVVDLSLNFKYGDDYRGIMAGIDAICCHQENCVPYVTILVDFPGTIQNLIKSAENNLERIINTKHEKMFWSRGHFMGYHFYYKREFKPRDIMVVMEDDGEGPLDFKQFSHKNIPYQKAKMPFNDSMLFQVVICPQPIKLESEPNNSNIYAVTYRMHHCVCDGKALLHYLKCVLSDGKNVIVKTPEVPAKFCLAKEWEYAKEFIKNIRVKEFPMIGKDENILRGYKLTEEKHLILFSDSSFEYMEKIRKLRRTIKGVTFLDVINTCLVSSLYDYYKKNTTDIPKSIVGGVVLTPEVACFAYGNSNFTLKNTFSAASFNLPIDIEGDNNNKLQSRLKVCQKEYNTVKSSFDVQFNYYFAKNIINMIPSPIAKFMGSFVQVTVGISSLPGGEKLTVFGGYAVKDMLLMPPNSPGTGLHIIIYTYGGQLRIGLTVDRGVIRSYDEAKTIVDGMVKYLDELSESYDNY